MGKSGMFLLSRTNFLQRKLTHPACLGPRNLNGRERREDRHVYRKTGVGWVLHADGDAPTAIATSKFSAFL